MKAKQNLKQVLWKIDDPEEAKTVETFIRVAVSTGQDPQTVMISWMQTFNETFKPKYTLLFEQELLSRISSTELSYTRLTLKKLRDSGKLVDKQNKPIWQTDGHYVVYYLEPMLEFIRERKGLKI